MLSLGEKIDAVVDLVNREMTGFSRGRIWPERFDNRYTSNCFGRAALVGAGLVAEGVDQEFLNLFISHEHATLYQGKNWNGHASLLLTCSELTAFVDALSTRIDIVMVRQDSGISPQELIETELRSSTLHPLATGIKFYQRSHPDFNQALIKTLDDYKDLYQRLAN